MDTELWEAVQEVFRVIPCDFCQTVEGTRNIVGAPAAKQLHIPIGIFHTLCMRQLQIAFNPHIQRKVNE